MDERPLKILIIQLGPLGNWVMATGFFRDLRFHYPNAILYHLTQTNFGELAMAQDCFDHLLLTRWEPPYNLRESFEALFLEPIWKKKISKIGFEIIFNLHMGNKVHNIFCRHLSHTHTKIFSIKKEYPHIVNVYQDAAIEAGISPSHLPQIKAGVPVQESQDHYEVSHLKIKKRFSVLIPRAKFEIQRKNWSVNKFMELALRLQKQNLLPLIAGHARDLSALKPLRKMSGNMDMVGQTTLPVLSGVLSKAQMVIGVDTGTTHLAAATGAPTVGLFGKGRLHFNTWGLRGPRVSCVCKNSMGEINVDEVWEMCLKYL